MTGSYASSLFASLPRDSLQHCLERALQETIRQHPNLRYKLVKDPAHSHAEIFVPARTISRQDVMEVLINKDGKAQQGEDVRSDECLRRQLEIAHTSLWALGKPAWKVVVIEHHARNSSSGNSVTSPTRLDVIFATHHAVADGLSGVVFHKSLRENLSIVSSQTLQHPVWPMVFDQEVPSPCLPEDSIDFPVATMDESSHDRNPVWAGIFNAGGGTQAFRSRVRLLTIPSSKMLSVIQTCKKQGITVTGYMHGIICASLLRSLTGTGVYDFRAVTPYSIRPCTKTSMREMVNHISYLTTLVSHETLDQIRTTEPHSIAEQKVVIDIARYFCAEISAELKRFPHGSVIARIRQIPDLWSHYREQATKASSTTYELSNLGATPIPCLEFAGSPLTVERLIFTQCGMVAGPALGVNCASIRDGPFTASITWEDGIVDDALVESIAQELERYLLNAGPEP